MRRWCQPIWRGPVYDEHKTVAVVYGTRGDGGNNEIGPEQALAMGQIREIEGRQAEASLGITNVWFLSGRDTASQNVLNSLEHWVIAQLCEQLVRIVRLTRPSVILTFFCPISRPEKTMPTTRPRVCWRR